MLIFRINTNSTSPRLKNCDYVDSQNKYKLNQSKIKEL